MTAVDDTGLQALMGLSHLEVLDLIGTGVTDASVNTLSKLTRLKDVDLSLTKVTPEGKQRLTQGLSCCLMTMLAQSIKGWLNAGLGFLFPETCQLCREARATPDEGFVCAACRARVRFVQAPFCDRCGLPFPGAITTRFTECANCRDLVLHFRNARSAVIARDQVLDVIHRYKYNRALWFEPFLAELLIRAAAPELAKESWQWLVPIPLHPTKQREREFNQAERLARRLSAATSIPMNDRLLRRVVPTRTQTLLTREERQDNVRNAFSLRGNRLNGERIVLVDDVFTTGATSSACAKVLRTGGAGEVCVWTVARGL